MAGRVRADRQLEVPAARDNPRVAFRYWYELAAGDAAYVYLRVDGGSWQNLTTLNQSGDGAWRNLEYSVAQYADEVAGSPASEPAVTEPAHAPPERTVASAGAMASLLGVYRDPWFGDVSICAHAQGVRFSSARSPLLTGVVMRYEERWLVDWIDESVDAEAWLDFLSPPQGTTALRMSRVDPDADSSYDYEDLAFTRVGECP